MLRSKIIFLISVTVLLSGCANLSIDIMFGKRISSDHFEGRDPTGTFRSVWKITPNVMLGYEHVSFIRNGKPFNDIKEDTIDQIILTIPFETKSRWPNVHASVGYKYKVDGFEGDDVTTGIRFNQTIQQSFSCEYQYLRSSFPFSNNEADTLQLISCGISINQE